MAQVQPFDKSYHDPALPERLCAPAGLRWGRVERVTGRHQRTASLDPPSARATAILVTGYLEFLEKYFEVMTDLAEMGFAVRALEWVGQGASARLVDDPELGYAQDFGEDVADLTDFLRAVEGPGPRLLFGHSMGGMLGLRACHEAPELIDRAVLSAPMLGLRTGWPAFALAAVARAMVKAGQGQRYLPGRGPWVADAAHLAGGDPDLSHDPLRGGLKERWFRARPELRKGGPGWAWLDAACRSMRLCAQPGWLREIPIPVLFGVAGGDVVVENRAIRRAAALVPGARLQVIEGAAHELWMEREDLREIWVAAVRAFVAPCL